MMNDITQHIDALKLCNQFSQSSYHNMQAIQQIRKEFLSLLINIDIFNQSDSNRRQLAVYIKRDVILFFPIVFYHQIYQLSYPLKNHQKMKFNKYLKEILKIPKEKVQFILTHPMKQNTGTGDPAICDLFFSTSETLQEKFPDGRPARNHLRNSTEMTLCLFKLF